MSAKEAAVKIDVKYDNKTHTVDSKVSKGGAGGALNLGIVAAEEEEDWIEGFATDRSDLFLGYFSECEGGAPLEINVVGKRKCRQRSKRRA